MPSVISMMLVEAFRISDIGFVIDSHVSCFGAVHDVCGLHVSPVVCIVLALMSGVFFLMVN